MSDEKIAYSPRTGDLIAAAGRIASDRRRRDPAVVASVAQKVEGRVGAFGMEVGVNVLCRGKRVGDVGLRAITWTQGTDLRAGLIFVVEPHVSGLGVEVYRSGAGGAWRRALVVQSQRAAGERANHRGIARDREISTEAQREGADGSAKRRRRWIVRQDNVGELL